MSSVRIEYSFLAPDRTVPYEHVGRFVARLQAEHPEQVISLVHDVKMDCGIDDLVAPLIFLHENGFITYDIFANTICAHREVLAQADIRPVLPELHPATE